MHKHNEKMRMVRCTVHSATELCNNQPLPSQNHVLALHSSHLCHSAVNADGWEVALVQQPVQLCCSCNVLDKDDHLVEVQRVQQVCQLAVLLLLVQHDVVLDKAVQSQFRLVVNVHLLGLWVGQKAKKQGDIAGGSRSAAFLA